MLQLNNAFYILETHCKILLMTELVNSKGKGKALPLQAWTGPQGSRRSRLTDL
jgi:hypothetical protein